MLATEARQWEVPMGANITEGIMEDGRNEWGVTTPGVWARQGESGGKQDDMFKRELETNLASVSIKIVEDEPYEKVRV